MTDLVFDDGSWPVEVECELDSPPKSGEWVDGEELALTPDELAAGEFLGLAIDINDDTDNGEQWGKIEDGPHYG